MTEGERLKRRLDHLNTEPAIEWPERERVRREHYFESIGISCTRLKPAGKMVGRGRWILAYLVTVAAGCVWLVVRLCR